MPVVKVDQPDISFDVVVNNELGQSHLFPRIVACIFTHEHADIRMYALLLKSTCKKMTTSFSPLSLLESLPPPFSSALRNSQLLGLYAAMDPRARQLIFLVKSWAKARKLNDAPNGNLSSYAHVILVVFFLITRKVG